jgi:hypothetical protein
VCTIVDLTCSSTASAITSEVAIRVASKSSATSENLALGLENDDYLALEASVAIQGAFEVRRSILISFCLLLPHAQPNDNPLFVALQDKLKNEMNEINNFTSSYFESLEEKCESLSAAAPYCQLALCLSLLAVGSQIMVLIDMRLLAFIINRPRKKLERETQVELPFVVA